MKARQARWALFLSRSNFTLTYHPGSRNVKPDVLSCQFALDLPQDSMCVVGVASWDIENTVREAQQLQSTPDDTPLGRPYMPDSAWSHVLKWAHSTKLMPSQPPVDSGVHQAMFLVAGPQSGHKGLCGHLLCLCPEQDLSSALNLLPRYGRHSVPPWAQWPVCPLPTPNLPTDKPPSDV